MTAPVFNERGRLLSWEEWGELQRQGHLRARIDARLHARERRLNKAYEELRLLDPLWHLAIVEKRVREEVAAEERAKRWKLPERLELVISAKDLEWISCRSGTTEPVSSRGFSVWQRLKNAWRAFMKSK